MDAPLAAKLSKFVEDGGTLFLTYRSGVKDEHNVVTDLTLPGPLSKLAAIAIHDYDPETNQKQDIAGHDGKTYPADVWFDILTPTNAVSIGRARKRLISAMLHRLSVDKLTPEMVAKLKGLLGFCIATEPGFVGAMRRKYGDKVVEVALQYEIPRKGPPIRLRRA